MSTPAVVASDELLIGDESIAAQASGRLSVLAASTEQPVGSVPDGTTADVDAGARAARAAFADRGVDRGRPAVWDASSDRTAHGLLAAQSIYEGAPIAELTH
jgi:acyl-CoA reductase-like NAD-dependent aldehyde dehydrogenase